MIAIQFGFSLVSISDLALLRSHIGIGSVSIVVLSDYSRRAFVQVIQEHALPVELLVAVKACI